MRAQQASAFQESSTFGCFFIYAALAILLVVRVVLDKTGLYPMARPSEYQSSFCKIAQKVTELGGTDQDVMDALGIAKTTFYRWRNEFDEFRNSLKVGKTPADERVEMSLYRRALGYSHEEDDIRAVNGEIVITPTIKYYPPDTTACIFWLKNRMPDKYRANPESVEVEEGVTIKVTRAKKDGD